MKRILSVIFASGFELTQPTHHIELNVPTMAQPYQMLVEIVPDNSAYLSDLGVTLALPSPVTSVAYTGAISGTGGVPPYTYGSTGTFPTGLTLNADGTITGTTTDQTYRPITFSVTDSSLTTVNITAAIRAVAPLTLTGAFAICEETLPYLSGLSASGGVPPYTFSFSSGPTPDPVLLPATNPWGALSLNTSTGIISGTVPLYGSDQAWFFTYRVTDSAGAFVEVPYYFISHYTIQPPFTFSQTVNFVAGTYQEYDTFGLWGSGGGVAPYYTSVSSIPHGMQLNALTGLIYGIPDQVGTTTGTLNATDLLGATGSNITLTFNVAQPVVTNTRSTSITFGNGALTTFTLTHNLGTKDVQVEIVEVSTGLTIEANVTRSTINAIVVDGFLTAPTAGQYRAVIEG